MGPFGGGVIDVHAHIVLDGTMGAAGPSCGPEIGAHRDGTPWFRVGDYRLDGVPYRGSLFMEASLRLAAMDEAGIRLQALSPNPLTYLYWIPPDNARDYCRRHNDDLAEVVGRHHHRFIGLAALPLQDVDLAVAELERAVKQLGLSGAYVGTDFGVPLDDTRLDPLYAACVELDVPLFFHPAPSGLDGPLRDDRMRRFGLDLVIEFSYEEVMAVATLIFGGVTRRHPTLDICVSHGGGSTPMHLAKLRKLAERSRPPRNGFGRREHSTGSCRGYGSTATSPEPASCASRSNSSAPTTSSSAPTSGDGTDPPSRRPSPLWPPN